MDLTTKKGHLTIRLSIHKESHRVLLRSAADTRIWFNMMMVSVVREVSVLISLPSIRPAVTRVWPGLSVSITEPRSITSSQSPRPGLRLYRAGCWADPV